MPAIIVFVIGALFALGLSLSGMTQPQKVIGFMDLGGDWDPSLAMVMLGAVVTYAIAFRVVVRRKGPVFASLFQIPTRRDITPSLVIGAALFGVGWGLVGLCPGPALVAAPAAAPTVAVFLVAMFAGMGAYAGFDSWRTASLVAGAKAHDADAGPREMTRGMPEQPGA